ncbi:hypothetical protein CR513_33149, partial [Mucuna pruriens]
MKPILKNTNKAQVIIMSRLGSSSFFSPRHAFTYFQDGPPSNPLVGSYQLQQCTIEEDTSTDDSLSTSIINDDIYYDIVGGVNGKGNFSLIEMPMIKQLEEMCKTIHKLNNELIAKEAKEKSLEEKVVQLMHNNEEQSVQM